MSWSHDMPAPSLLPLPPLPDDTAPSASGSPSGPHSPTHKLVWYAITCATSAIIGAASYMSGYYTQPEARALEQRMTDRIDRVDDRLDLISTQVIEIAKTVGAKQILAPSSQAVAAGSQPAK